MQTMSMEPGEVHQSFKRQAETAIVRLLSMSFERVQQLRYIPDAWKKAPLYKNGNEEELQPGQSNLSTLGTSSGNHFQACKDKEGDNSQHGFTKVKDNLTAFYDELTVFAC